MQEESDLKVKPILIRDVQPDSVASDAGIEPEDLLLSINDHSIKDMFDYRYHMVNEQLDVVIKKKDGELWEIDIEKEEYEDLGLEFEDSLMDEAKSCTNNCIFCFIDQLPKGMRNTVYFKDDDSRLSFLSGNYVTLTNMKNDEIDRIIQYRMSPLNVSVHTTNPELRKTMLRNRFAGGVLERIKRLTDGGITVNAQIVLCPGINDGEQLDRTISDLSGLYPGIGSISVVPVGITKCREGLYRLKPYDKDLSLEAIRRISGWQDKLLAEKGSRVVYAADEFYIMSESKLPEYDEYEDFPQIENGVGLVSLFRHEFDEYINEIGDISESRHISIATGILVYNYIKQMAYELEKRYNNLRVEVFPIKNVFFGENVTVTGLLTGGDIVSQLKNKEIGTELLISRSMLKSGEDVLLDDYTTSDLEENLRVKITVVENNGKDFINKILGMDIDS
jgi:putative radical SAM enzyme (TIGR03279 family)